MWNTVQFYNLYTGCFIQLFLIRSKLKYKWQKFKLLLLLSKLQKDFFVLLNAFILLPDDMDISLDDLRSLSPTVLLYVHFLGVLQDVFNSGRETLTDPCKCFSIHIKHILIGISFCKCETFDVKSTRNLF